MRPRDWFSVGVRLFSVWVIYDGLVYAMAVFADRLVHFARSEVSRELDTARSTTTDYLVYAVGSIACGFILLIGAERLTRWTFNEPSPAEDNAPETEVSK